MRHFNKTIPSMTIPLESIRTSGARTNPDIGHHSSGSPNAHVDEGNGPTLHGKSIRNVNGITHSKPKEFVDTCVSKPDGTPIISGGIGLDTHETIPTKQREPIERT